MRRILAIVSFACVGAACSGGPTGTISTPLVAISSTAQIDGGVFPGDSVQLVAQTYTAKGGVTNGTITWTSGAPAVATVSSTGLVRAISGGAATITASYQNASDFRILVVDGNVSASVGISPATATTRLGTPFQFLALIRTTQGNPRRGGGAVWSTTDVTKVSIDATGKAMPLAVTPGVPICVAAPDAPALKTCGTLTITP